MIFTIGFTQTTAENFFERLSNAGVERVVDVRLRTDSQLSGFAKRGDLKFFLSRLLNVDYVHVPSLAPTAELLDDYKKRKIGWADYEQSYRNLIVARKVEMLLSPSDLEGACLLCSEALPHKCHRRIAADYLTSCWGRQIDVRHL